MPGDFGGDCKSIREPTNGFDLDGARQTCTWGLFFDVFLRLKPGSLILMLCEVKRTEHYTKIFKDIEKYEV